ncbi:MAG: tRNA pseudouridine(38-40) synthase TruA, partial [Gammaproteobacteria bacterium]|nr:tRNA pseudouridine(38-40) synthase TruA [Gammaproteobacteria bacterium]
ECDGSAFSGFQLQKTSPSVQGALEKAFSEIANQPVRIHAAGRTDAGVHATNQVVGFNSPVTRPLDAWRRGTNSLTPAAVKVRWVREVDADFHARYSATARRYMYLWYEDQGRSPTLDGWAVNAERLDDEAMHQAGLALVGEHDFTSFRAAGCQSQSAHRCVHRVAVHRYGGLVMLDITANAFLLHMVRNIAAGLVDVGGGVRPAGWLGELLQKNDRRLLGPTAPARGLYLVGVRYPEYQLPDGEPPGPLRALGALSRF